METSKYWSPLEAPKAFCSGWKTLEKWCQQVRMQYRKNGFATIQIFLYQQLLLIFTETESQSVFAVGVVIC